jgi:membrane-bound metal-dependent hydrolase YbcI (DUF457 family)
MFIGHFAVAYAGKRVAPRTNLGWLIFCAQFADLLWPVLVLQGVEIVRIAPGDTAFTPLRFEYYPWSHSLLMDVIWGVVLASIYYTLRRDRNGAGVSFVLVVSHWVLDWITHRPDMPFYPGGVWRVGLGLWNSVPLTIAVEALMFGAGVWVYMSTTEPRDRIGRYGAWALVAFLVAIYTVNASSPPPPPSVMAVALVGLLGWPLVLWPWWTDRHRTT